MGRDQEDVGTSSDGLRNWRDAVQVLDELIWVFFDSSTSCGRVYKLRNLVVRRRCLIKGTTTSLNIHEHQMIARMTFDMNYARFPIFTTRLKLIPMEFSWGSNELIERCWRVCGQFVAGRHVNIDFNMLIYFRLNHVRFMPWRISETCVADIARISKPGNRDAS